MRLCAFPAYKGDALLMMDNPQEKHGRLIFWAVAEDEPMGKPLAECRRVPLNLTLIIHGEISDKTSQAALRQIRIRRLTQESIDQGGVLTLEELASILTSSYSTIVRDATLLRRRGECIPTRGQIKDIGRSLEGRLEIIRRYSSGESPEKIAEATHRSVTDVIRPIRRFEEVCQLLEKKMPLEKIVKLLGISPRLVEAYQEIQRQNNI